MKSLTSIPLFGVVLNLFLASGCGVQTVSTLSENGYLSIAIDSDHYLTDQATLANRAVVTGHAQVFSIVLTAAGEDEAGDNSGAITIVTAAAEDGGSLDAVTMEQDSIDPLPETSEEEEADSTTTNATEDSEEGEDEEFGTRYLTITVTTPGTYRFEARRGTEVFDSFNLKFDAPDALESVVYTLAPNAADFTKLTFDSASSATVAAGTQVSWIKSGTRLIGEIKTTEAFSDTANVVPVRAVDHINENGVVTLTNEPSYVFLAAGSQTLTVTDSVNNLSGVLNFVVQ